MLLGVGVYTKQPIFKLDSYIDAVNHKDFEEVYALLYKDSLINDENKKQIIDYMERYFGNQEFVGLKRTSVKGRTYTLGSHQKERTYYEVDYLFAKEKISNGLSLVQERGKWQVVFPFKITDVTIYAPTGTDVFFDGQQLERREDNTYCMASVLPGTHHVRMKFPNAIYSDWFKTIEVPAEKQIFSPYETVQVSIDAPINTMIELAGEKKINVEGTLVFDNVLEGAYKLKVTDPHGHLENDEQTIEVSKTNKHFDVEGLTFSESGKARITKYIEGFYKKYQEGMTTQNVKFWEQYGDMGTWQEMATTYEEWFIKSKDVKEATIDYRIESIEGTAEGCFNIQVLEEVNLLNKEGQTGRDERQYQITLQTQLVLKPVGKSYIIQDKTIEESMVSYQDELGKWIAY